GEHRRKTTAQLDLIGWRYWRPVKGRFFFAQLGILEGGVQAGLQQDFTSRLYVQITGGIYGYLSDSGDDLFVLQRYGSAFFPRVASQLASFPHYSTGAKVHLQYSDHWSSDLKILDSKTILTNTETLSITAQATYLFGQNWSLTWQGTAGHSPGYQS